LKEENMPDIRHRVVISASPQKVYEALATKEGISEWWTRDGVKGESATGAKLEFYFGSPEPAAVMEVTELEPDRAVSWRCIEGESEWVGTQLGFELTPNETGTVVLFSHADWRRPSEFMAHCSARWAYFLLSLKAYTETGSGTPFPEDLKF
jgi:uncharacterized protein YndB with AHSA1/START domain